MLADTAQILGGSCVEATALMGPGVDPHVYQASASDVDRLRRAELILFGGLNLEGRMSDVLSQLGRRTASLAALEQIPEADLLALPGYAGHHDPHLWMDVSLWARTLSPIADALVAQRPGCREAIEANAAAYAAELAAFDEWVRASLATIPEGQRALVTAHDAFHYFSRAYGVEVVGIQGVSTQAEASLADIGQVVSFIVERRIPAIFVESSVNPRNIEAVRAAVEARGWQLAQGGQLFSDAMGEGGTWQGTYIGMLRSNVLTIVTALGGQPAAWPEALSGFAQRWGIL
jgi:manganese/zinc/iron transport system substrate-binding protein